MPMVEDEKKGRLTMTNKEERMKVLEMVRDGVISAEEAAQLLEAMSDPVERPVAPRKPAGSNVDTRGKFFRVRITDAATNKPKVNVTLPLSLINVAMKTGAKFAPEIDEINMQEIWEAIQDGATGKIVDVMDSDDGQHVEVYID